MAITLMICFARSGGTILNRCLASLPNVVMLSEVNPLGGGGIHFNTPKEQAKNWYDIPIHSNDVIEGIIELEKYCNENNKYLIVRDWSFINFVPHKLNNNNPPNKLALIDSLKNRTQIVPFAFMRDAIDIWISRKGSINEFFSSYSNYVYQILKENLNIFKYEDFCIDPKKEIKKICEFADINYNDSFLKFSAFDKVNGDVQIKGGSRGGVLKSIKPLPRKYIAQNTILELNKSKKMQKCNRDLGYPIRYQDVRRENIVNAFSYKIKKKLRKITKI